MKFAHNPTTADTLQCRPLMKLLCGIALIFSSAVAIADTLVAQVDRTTIGLNEGLQLTLIYNGSSSRDANTDILNSDFNVLSRSKSSSTRMSFGSSNTSSATTQWNIQLSPKRAGNLTIPAFVIDGISSDPITITVKTQAPSSSGNNKGQPIYVETDISSAKPYVQQQTLLTIRLISELNLSETDFDHHDPIVPSAKVEKVYAGSYRRQMNGRPQIVLEKIYAIFPQSAGALTIPSVPASVIYEKPGSNPRMSFFNRGQRVQRSFQSSPQTLHVQDKPPQTKPWLPASKVTLSEHWSSSPQNFVVGEPITRDITIEAEGLLASQLPELEIPQQAGIKLYPDQPQLDNQLSNTGVVGSRALSTAIVISKPGRYQLPAITLKWWDLANKRVRSSTLAAVDIVVNAAAGSATNNLNEAFEPSDTEPSPAPITEIEQTGSTAEASRTSNYWILSTAILAISNVALALLAFKLWNKTRSTESNKPLMRPIGNPTTLKQALKELQRHCQSGLLSGVRSSLIVWGQLRWPQAGINSLAQLKTQFKAQLQAQPKQGGNSEQLLQIIDQLDSALYGGGSKEIDLAKLYQAVNSIAANKQQANSKEPGLRPLYR